MTSMPTYFISHGGGPWPWMSEVAHTYRELRYSLEALPRELPAPPRAILMISGHWEKTDFALTSHAAPPMLYDYGGFPEHTYQIQYPAPGSPALAAQVQDLLARNKIVAYLDPARGFDHGAFTPLAVSFPKANVPVVQLSLRKSYDPAEHLALGQALRPLRDEGVLIVGSGLSYHNLREMGHAGAGPSRDFDGWLQQTVVASPPNQRRSRLLDWATAPAARRAHPREDHLLPLMVAVGAAGDDPASLCYHERDFFGGLVVSSFRFGE